MTGERSDARSKRVTAPVSPDLNFDSLIQDTRVRGAVYRAPEIFSARSS